MFHDKIIKRFILTNKVKKKAELKKLLISMLENNKSLIDVSCGDDTFLFKIAKDLKFDLIVGNDISWSQINDNNIDLNEVIFTNHNAASLPFPKSSFDISFCSNTLHHMKNKETMLNLLLSSFNVSKKLIIIEIENPKITGGFSKILNKYWYMKFLKDVGGAYLDESQFRTLINKTFNKKAEIKYHRFRNITGNYMIAEIYKKEKK